MKKIAILLNFSVLFLSTLLSTNGFSQTTINFEDFESGSFPYTLWNDGGNDCSENTSSTLSGSDCALLRDNSGGNSSMYTNNIDLTSYTSVDITFDYRTSNFSGSEDFFIEFSNDGGSSWNATPIINYVVGTNFNNNTTYNNVLVSVTNGGTYTFTSNSRFRFRCDASSNFDNLFIDEILIKGYAAALAPEINITGLGNSIGDGDTSPSTIDDTDFGSQDITVGSNSNTFTIQNTGTSPLNLTDISPYIVITGDTSDFTLSVVPVDIPTTPIGASGSTTFTITFNPTTTGLRTAQVSIANNDDDEGTYTFDIQGTGVIATFSEVIVSVNWPLYSSENTVDIYNPSGTLVGSITDPTGSGNSTYSTSLNLGCLEDLNNYYFIMYDTANDGWDGTDNITITVGGTTVINQNGNTATSGGTTTNFNVSGNSCAPASEIDIQGNGISISDGDSTPSLTDDTDFGNQDITIGSNTNTFTIYNTGTGSLNLTGGPLVAIGGTNSGDFSVTSTPESTVSGGGNTTFIITFNPSATGLRTATVTIANDDSDENPYTFNIQGTGTTTTQEINIQGNSTDIATGDTTPSITDDTNFGSVLESGGTNVNIFTIQNLGTSSSLNLTGVSPYAIISGTHASDFTVTTIPSSTIGASSSTTFAITFDPSALGLRTATVTITNNDSNESSYTFNIQGTGVNVTGPGGIDTNLELWLKGNAGLSYTTGQPVTTWQDQTSNGHDASAPVVGVEPTYRDDPAYNINFNPVVDFNNNSSAFSLDSDFSFDDTTTEFLQGSGGYYSQDVFVVLIPNVTVNDSFGSMDVFCGDENLANNETDATGIGLGAYSIRFSGEIISYAHGTTSSGNGYGVAETGTGNTYSNAGIINARNNSGTTQQELYYNATDIETTQNDVPDFANVNNSRYWIGRSEGWEATTDARIAEIITYSSRKSDADLTQERNRIQSYLAIKYGITLGLNGTSQDYVDSNGNIIWDQSANSGYNYNIAGIGLDYSSELNQKQSSSINNANDGSGPTEGILTIGLSDIYTTNNNNISNNPTSLNDKEFLVWGDNGVDLNLAAAVVSVDMSAGISGLSTPVTFTAMQRVWKVVENGGDIPSCKVRIPQNAIRNINPPGSYLMFISDTGVFDPTADYRVMTPDGSGNLEANYDFDGTKYITFGYAPQVIVERSVYFDGVADYIDIDDTFDLNTTEFTISSWIKRDAGTINASIISKRDAANTEGYDLRINGSGRLEFTLNGGAATITSSVDIPENEWHQVAVIYNSGTATLYIDGVPDTTTIATSLPVPVATTQSFLIAAADGYDPNTTDYFAGNIDEVRVWNVALSQDQLRYIMNQEIMEIIDVSGTLTPTLIRGNILPIGITKNEINSIPWSDLAGYYPMSVYTYTNTNDHSGNNKQGALRNLNTVDNQTAPLPYESQAAGSWDTDATWLNNTVQTLPNAFSIIDGTTPIDWNIVEINHDIYLGATPTAVRSRDCSVEGLIINSGDLQVNGDTTSNTGVGLTVTHYLKLDGSIDLEGESQLIQTTGSDLDPTSNGSLERDQQGTADTYTYNYWSSPVGQMNNTTNNNSFNVTDVFNNLSFLTSGYNGTPSPLAIADYWIWKFNNLPSDDYASWQHVRSTGSLLVGEGFTMKGPGSGSISTPENYVLLGKPNNGDVNLPISAGNDYLVGNPYPSAIDANQFILDNGSTIDGAGSTTGTLYFWEHWGGNSHVLAAYQGGYATYSLAGGVPAAAMGTNDPDVGTGGTPTKTPGRYIPVAQGFFVTAEATGTIQFNNGQRVFEAEGSANSVFAKSTDSKTSKSTANIQGLDLRSKLRLGFNSVNSIRRQLLMTVDEVTTKGFDWGYDAPYNDSQVDDMYWMIDNNKYTIQGIDSINEQTILPLGIHTKNDGVNSITIDKLDNIPNNLNIYVHDKELEIYHNLKESNYDIFLNSGEYLDRFEITFSNASSLNTNDFEKSNIEVSFSNEKRSIIIQNPNSKDIEYINLHNILGQSIYNIDANTNESYIEHKTHYIKTGVYIIKLKTSEGIFSKKVLIK
ncbi:choice-of-anchor D domain-containing protein [Thalassobellus citreus]|uniref:choice-of-anchor D domain-containing protein n=1 Tax=Thalassobellus citreus TaxID=3367752 RepID=UPI0037A9A6D2